MARTDYSSRSLISRRRISARAGKPRLLHCLAGALVAVAFATPVRAEQDGASGGTAVPAPQAESSAVCTPGSGDGPRVKVKVDNLQGLDGNIRVQVYGDNPDDFLAKGKKLVRIDVPIIEPDMEVCVPIPRPGDYALVVMHDKNANGRADFLTEGFGFSNNPKLGLGAPDLDEVLVKIAQGVTEMDVRLTYIFEIDNKHKRRRRRR